MKLETGRHPVLPRTRGSQQYPMLSKVDESRAALCWIEQLFDVGRSRSRPLCERERGRNSSSSARKRLVVGAHDPVSCWVGAGTLEVAKSLLHIPIKTLFAYLDERSHSDRRASG
jgi:hypothetical protein